MSELIDKYGWFEYKWSDDKSYPLSIHNFKSNQTLNIKSTQDIKGYGDDKLFYATYSDDDFSRPIAFQIKRNKPFGGKPSEHFNIYLDYADCYETEPPYGSWRRVDDFIYDALLCWQALKISNVVITGGWYADKWSTKLQRTYLVINGIRYSKENKATATPHLYSLNSETPKSWQLVDVIDTPKTEATLEYEVYENSLMRYLPKDKPATGFQGKVPYLRRTDGKSYFFFAEVNHSIHGYSDCAVTTSYYTYVDENVFFTFRSLHSFQSELGRSVNNYGFRNLYPEEAVWFRNYEGSINPTTQKTDEQYVHLSYEVWLKTRHAFCSAWKQWQKCKYRLKKTNTENYYGKDRTFKWDEPYGGQPNIEYGFVAGMRQRLRIIHDFPEDS